MLRGPLPCLLNIHSLLCLTHSQFPVQILMTVIVKCSLGCFLAIECNEGKSPILLGLFVLRKSDAQDPPTVPKDFFYIFCSATESKIVHIDGVFLDQAKGAFDCV